MDVCDHWIYIDIYTHINAEHFIYTLYVALLNESRNDGHAPAYVPPRTNHASIQQLIQNTIVQAFSND